MSDGRGVCAFFGCVKASFVHFVHSIFRILGIRSLFVLAFNMKNDA